MYTAIKGVYENGKITFTEEPPVKSKAEVVITFLTGQDSAEKSQQRKLKIGLLEGKIKLPDDFNEPLDDLEDYM
ncbi:DUF2281 domain-containing protein [Parapedobacter sp. DT-150]|uniref:DUF2281 domain-containing protein n=1 Tax=Parapedobacter sp. DT-150 TaxID=3396162 RepID=UPI003F1D3594